MGMKLSEKDGAFIRQGHKAFAEPGTLCRCGGELRGLSYSGYGNGWSDGVWAEGEKRARDLKVCEECGAVYAMPMSVERGA